MGRYIKLPVEIEAIQWVETNIEEIKKFVGNDLIIDTYTGAWEAGVGPIIRTLKIKTLEGEMNISKNDYIIRGVNGEFYPCKPDIFIKTYKEIEDE